MILNYHWKHGKEVKSSYCKLLGNLLQGGSLTAKPYCE